MPKFALVTSCLSFGDAAQLSTACLSRAPVSELQEAGASSLHGHSTGWVTGEARPPGPTPAVLLAMLVATHCLRLGRKCAASPSVRATELL